MIFPRYIGWMTAAVGRFGPPKPSQTGAIVFPGV